MVTLSFRIGKVHHIILRCEGEARASKERAKPEPRRRGRGVAQDKGPSLEGEDAGSLRIKA